MAHRCTDNIKKLKLGEIIIIISPFLALIFYKFCNLIGLKTICIWKLLTGHKCFGCGMTHAIVSLLKLNFSKAIEYNPLVIIVFPLLLYLWLKYIYQKVFK